MRRGCRGGCLMTGVAFLLIAAVAGVLVWRLAIEPSVRDFSREQLNEGAAEQVQQITRVPVLPSGELVVTSDEINAQLRENADLYAPITDPRIEIAPSGIEVSFKLYRFRSTYRGKLAARDGRLVVTDAEADGPAARVLRIDDVAAVVEQQLAALLARSNLRAVDVELRDGAMAIQTEPADAT